MKGGGRYIHCFFINWKCECNTQCVTRFYPIMKPNFKKTVEFQQEKNILTNGFQFLGWYDKESDCVHVSGTLS